MTDHGHELTFGLFLDPGIGQLATTLALAELADVVGLEHVTAADHPYNSRQLDTWTLLAAIGARTTSVRLAPNVACLPLRPPVVLARSVATLDVLTGGRVDLGLGSGAFWDAIAAAGGPRRTSGEAVDALLEAIPVIRAVWAGGTVRAAGPIYPVDGLHGGPPPAHDVPIWLGAYRPRMLRATADLADGWLPSMGYADPPDLPRLSELIDDRAAANGRGPGAIRRLYNISGRFGSGREFLQGTADDWAEQLAELTLTVGMSTYLLGTDDADTVRRFAQEVAPDTRERVAAARARRSVASLDTLPVTAPPVERSRTGDPVTERVEVRDRGPLRVSATPDDGTRLTGTAVWDESTRPHLPEPAGAEYTADQQAFPAELIAVHQHLRTELDQVRDILRQVRAGSLDVGAARSAVNAMTMRQNNWTLGAYCESYCRVVTTHHTLEDTSLFPMLRRADPGLRPVIDRLESEHHVIHDVLDRVDRALVSTVDADNGERADAALADLQHAIDLLSDTLLSHLAYEERELLHPLALHVR